MRVHDSQRHTWRGNRRREDLSELRGLVHANSAPIGLLELIEINAAKHICC